MINDLPATILDNPVKTDKRTLQYFVTETAVWNTEGNVVNVKGV